MTQIDLCFGTPHYPYFPLVPWSGHSRSRALVACESFTGDRNWGRGRWVTLIDPCFGLHKERVATSQQQHKLYLHETKNLQFCKSIEIESTINTNRN